MATRPLPLPEPDQTRMNAAAASALSMQEQAIQGGKKVIAIPHVNHRAIVMVALEVPMQTIFSLLTAIWLGRQAEAKPETLHEKNGVTASATHSQLSLSPGMVRLSMCRRCHFCQLEFF